LELILLEDKELLKEFINLSESWTIILIPTIEEKEIKILNINKEKLLKKLEEKVNKKYAEKTFDWEVEDIFYDYNEKSLSSKWIKLRIREKKENWESKYYCTLKKKIIKHKWWKKLKISHECEIEIKDIEKFKTVIWNYKLVETQKRIKDRISYLLNIKWKDFVVVDIDKYHDWHEYTDSFAEIEWQTLKNINIARKKIWLYKKETFTWWANDLFRKWKKS
jgi:adenylate cyclase class IV